MIELDRYQAAYDKVRLDLLAERNRSGFWTGRLSASALSTATAVSALALVERHEPLDAKSGRFADETQQGQRSELIVRGLHWLADHQNDDGGWGDTDLSGSNIATTMLVLAAFQMTGVPADHTDLLAQARQYVAQQGGTAALRRRYGIDKTFAVPILANCALAGLVPWREVSPLPFEAACLPQWMYRFLRLPVVSYAIPALVAVGQARFLMRPPLNPLMRLIRRAAVKPSLQVLENMQPDSGGYLEAVPLTSFVVMCLAGTARASHPVAQRGVEFLLEQVRDDGSWPIDTDLATWNTTLATNALAAGGDDVFELTSCEWLLSCQHRELHPFTGAAPGGWGWSDKSGAVPDVDDTSGALLALAAMRQSPSCDTSMRGRIDESAEAGVKWLLEIQNADDGWPTFCRGWGRLPFDRSGTDLTAHALRALLAWRDQFHTEAIDAAVRRGLEYLGRTQREDGSWVPLWFGNEGFAGEENPVYGTARVLLAYRDLDRLETQPARRGLNWLREAQNSDGGWGFGAIPKCAPGETASRTADLATAGDAAQLRRIDGAAGAAGAASGLVGTVPVTRRSTVGCRPLQCSSVEETAVALDALASASHDESLQDVLSKGLDWLAEAVETDRYRQCAPIGFYFAKLWYYERLYPMTFTASALAQSIRQLSSRGVPGIATRMVSA